VVLISLVVGMVGCARERATGGANTITILAKRNVFLSCVRGKKCLPWVCWCWYDAFVHSWGMGIHIIILSAEVYMHKFSLTQLVDIVSSSGISKVTKVIETQIDEPYTPAKDFYRIIREHIKDCHKIGKSKNEFLDFKKNYSERKKDHYEELISGYHKWWGKKKFTWFEPATNYCRLNNIQISINPELGLKFGGKKHIIKLYFKSEKLSKRKIDLILFLLHKNLANKADENTLFCVLDIRHSRLHKYNLNERTLEKMELMLKAEIGYIQSLLD